MIPASFSKNPADRAAHERIVTGFAAERGLSPLHRPHIRRVQTNPALNSLCALKRRERRAPNIIGLRFWRGIL